MSLLFDPLYPTVVQYVVSKSIWELYEIHFWQVLFGMWGKNRAFFTLQHRYEKNHYEGPALAFLVVVFALTYLIQWLMTLREQNAAVEAPEEPRDNPVVDHNQNVINDAVDGNADNEEPNLENNQ